MEMARVREIMPAHDNLRSMSLVQHTSYITAERRSVGLAHNPLSVTVEHGPHGSLWTSDQFVQMC